MKFLQRGMAILILLLAPILIVTLAQAAEVDQVKSIYDGDTLTVTLGRVRLVQIDTPELKPDECFGKQARSILVDILPIGSKVKLVKEPLAGGTDAYKRYLRYVIYNRRNINIRLVSAGAATPYFYRGVEGRYANALLRARKSAARNKRGMWGMCRVVWNSRRAVSTYYP